MLNFSTRLRLTLKFTRVFQLGMMVLGFATGRASANISFAKSLIDSDDHKKKLLAKLATLESALPPVEASGQ